jgi:hypothetical protein
MTGFPPEFIPYLIRGGNDRNSTIKNVILRLDRSTTRRGNPERLFKFAYEQRRR